MFFSLFACQVFFSVIIGSFSLGNALPEIETFATALGSATVVFKVIDRVSPLIRTMKAVLYSLHAVLFHSVPFCLTEVMPIPDTYGLEQARAVILWTPLPANYSMTTVSPKYANVKCA